MSAGTGSLVRLPGPSIDKPNIFQFGYPYENMFQELKTKDAKLLGLRYFNLNGVYSAHRYALIPADIRRMASSKCWIEIET
jgi:hypothetical protein